MRKSWLISGLFLCLISFFCNADTIDFWQLRRGDSVVAQGFPSAPVPTNPLSISLNDLRKTNWSVLYGGCIPVERIRLKCISGTFSVELEVTAANGFRLLFPDNALQLTGKKWQCYLCPDRSADGVSDYFHWLDIMLLP